MKKRISLNIKDKIVQNLIKVYLVIMIGFYPLALMYKDEYNVVPIKIEGVLYSVFLGLIVNSGLLLVLTDLGLRWKKITFCILVMSAASSWFIFYLPTVNPMASISDAGWVYVRSILSFACLGFVLFIMSLFGLHKNEV